MLMDFIYLLIASVFGSH